MLRELSHLLGELHDGLLSIEGRSGVSLTQVDMTLPLELRPVFRNGGCVLLADVARSRGIDEWTASPSKLRLAWGSEKDRARHSRERGNPVPFAAAQAKSLDPRLRGDDGRGSGRYGDDREGPGMSGDDRRQRECEP